MLAFATVLSIIKLVDLPYGGSVTVCSMLPIILIAYRYGALWGACTSVTYSLIQLMLGAGNLSYATSPMAVVCIILFDYVLAFGVLFIAGFFTKSRINQSVSLTVSVITSGTLRYLFHVIVGYVVWRDISIPETEAWIYSFGYNASYMLPEIIVTAIGALYISRVLDFRSRNISKISAPTETKKTSASVLSILSKTVPALGAFTAVCLLAPHIQSESGVISLGNIPSSALINAGVVLAATIIAGIILHLTYFFEKK